MAKVIKRFIDKVTGLYYPVASDYLDERADELIKAGYLEAEVKAAKPKTAKKTKKD